MTDFNAFPSTVNEVDGEICVSYQPGNNNEPRYPRYDQTIDCCAQLAVDYSTDEED